MSDAEPGFIVTTTVMVAPDPLAELPDDERRLILAWRNTRREARSGVASLTIILWTGQMLLFAGLPAGKIVLR